MINRRYRMSTSRFRQTKIDNNFSILISITRRYQISEKKLFHPRKAWKFISRRNNHLLHITYYIYMYYNVKLAYLQTTISCIQSSDSFLRRIRNSRIVWWEPELYQLYRNPRNGMLTSQRVKIKRYISKAIVKPCYTMYWSLYRRLL